MTLIELQTIEERISLLEKTAKTFSERAAHYDETSSFPFENFHDLKAINYPALTIPKKYGGMGISLYELVRLQEIIAKYDGSTALSIGWHMGIMKSLGENQVWEEKIYNQVAENVIKYGALINNAQTEPATGSPTRGGKPETVAKKTHTGWVITGRKTFTTLAPILDYFVVSASIENSDRVGNFLIKRDDQGVTIDETWNSIAMRATGSHDLVLDQVNVSEENLVEYITPGQKPAAGWLLHIPACYLGIARAAHGYAVQFAKTYVPSSINKPIAEMPNVKQKIGEMKLRILESEHFLYSVAKKWDESTEDEREMMKPELGSAKLLVVNKAIEIVDIAMRLVGARSLAISNPLQRYYRDVRAGLHNPPMDDMTMILLADHSLK